MTRPAGWPWHDDPENGRWVAEQRDKHQRLRDGLPDPPPGATSATPDDDVRELLSGILAAIKRLDQSSTYWSVQAIRIALVPVVASWGSP